MDPKSHQSKRRDNTLSLLNVTIETFNLTKEILSITPAKAVCGSVSVILTMIRDSMTNEADYVELGLACAGVCTALGRGMDGKKLDNLSQSVCDAISQLTTTVAEIERKVIKQSGRNTISRVFHAKNDKEAIVAWKLDLNRTLHVFNTELIMNTHVVVSDVRRNVADTHIVVSDVRQNVVDTHTAVFNIHTDVVNTHATVSNVHRGVANTHTIVSELQRDVTDTRAIVSDIHRTVVESQEGADGKNRLIQTSMPGESPPPPPRACFGRDELIEEIVGLAENLTPIALVGPGGIGKTSIALAVLHHDRIKRRFEDNRRFIRCDEFPPSRTHLLNRLSKVIGAGVENPEGLAPLRPFLSKTGMILFLDNAESILDPQGENARDIYAVVEELSRFDNICLCLTSRISTIPPACETLDIPTLSIEAARDTFHRIYKNGGQSDPVDRILRQLDFHPLSITLLATVAHHSKWDVGRLTREWQGRRTDVLRTRHDDSLAATIELSLASPMFQELGPDAREVLGIVAFFPQGIDENNLDWLFPDLFHRANVFDNFSILSLTHRSNGFITMLAPLRDHLCPKDPASSPLLNSVKDRYFTRLLDLVDPGFPGFEDARWIITEDVNVEYLLDVFTSVDANSVNVWNACACFMEHLRWHKVRLVALGPKIERLPDDHPSKPGCLMQLSRLFNLVGNDVEQRWLLEYTLELWRGRGEDSQVAMTLRFLSDVNTYLGHHEEGIEQAKEALEIYKRLDNITGQALTWKHLAVSLSGDKQFDAAEEASLRAIDLLADGDKQLTVCDCYRILGDICCSKGEMEKAVSHFETALGIASRFNYRSSQSWINYELAELFFGEDKFDEAHAHVELAKSHATKDPYQLARAMELQARFWYEQRKFGEAKLEALGAISVYERIGAANDVEDCRRIIRDVEKATGKH